MLSKNDVSCQETEDSLQIYLKIYKQSKIFKKKVLNVYNCLHNCFANISL